jgi:hypothetical protein
MNDILPIYVYIVLSRTPILLNSGSQLCELNSKSMYRQGQQVKTHRGKFSRIKQTILCFVNLQTYSIYFVGTIIYTKQNILLTCWYTNVLITSQ